MEQDKPKKSESVGQTLPVAMEIKKGGFIICLDSFHQTSRNFVGISTVVCGSFRGFKKFKMAAVGMAAKCKNPLIWTKFGFQVDYDVAN